MPNTWITAGLEKMTFPRAAAALTVFLTMAPSPLCAQAKSVVQNRFPAELDAYIAKAVKDWEIPGLSIAIVRNDSVIVVKGYGVREMGKPGKVDEHTVFDAVHDSIVPGSAPPRPLPAYAGAYVDSLYGELTVRIEKGALVLQMGREAAELSHRSADTFHVRWRDPLFDELYTTNGTFTAGAGGTVDAFTMRLNRDTVSVRRAAGR